jgi:hypothetical protein
VQNVKKSEENQLSDFEDLKYLVITEFMERGERREERREERERRREERERGEGEEGRGEGEEERGREEEMRRIPSKETKKSQKTVIEKHAII